MKKGLLLIASALFLSTTMSAQMTWEVEDGMSVTTSLTGFIPANDFDTDPAVGNVDDGWAAQYTHSWVGANNDVLKISFEQKNKPQYDAFALNTIQWDDAGSGSNYKFTKNAAGEDTAHSVARGIAVDFSGAENAMVSFKYQVLEDIYLRVDMGDIAGKTTNAQGLGKEITATAGGVDIADESKWEEITLSWDDAVATLSIDGMSDMYSPKWWDVVNPDEGTTAHDLDKTRIIKMALTFNDGDRGIKTEGSVTGSTTELYLKDIVWGNATVATAADTYRMWVDVETVEGNKLETVGNVVYSATITVVNAIGQVVASAQGQLDLSTLPAGVYSIVTAEGTAKIVK